MTPDALQLEDEPVQPFFIEQGRLKFLDGTELVAFERDWENSGFLKGTDAQAFRIMLRHAVLQIPGQEGAFLVRNQQVPELLRQLSELYEESDARWIEIAENEGVRQALFADGLEIGQVGYVPEELMDVPYCPPGVRYD